MITKISVQLPKSLAWEDIGNFRKLSDAAIEIKAISDQIAIIEGIIDLATNNPLISVLKAIHAYSTDDVIINERTKKIRTYSIKYLTITETD